MSAIASEPPLDENNFSRAKIFEKRRYLMYSGDLNKELVRYLNDQMVPYSSHGLNNALKVCYEGQGLRDIWLE